MKKLIILILILFLGGIGGFYVFNLINPGFDNLSSEEMREKIIKERDVAIAKAVEAGDYRCCIEPACTMCFMEANQWNNYTPGTCACDDLIAEGKEACPQCGRELANLHSEENTYCDINAEISTCGSDENK